MSSKSSYAPSGAPVFIIVALLSWFPIWCFLLPGSRSDFDPVSSSVPALGLLLLFTYVDFRDGARLSSLCYSGRPALWASLPLWGQRMLLLLALCVQFTLLWARKYLLLTDGGSVIYWLGVISDGYAIFVLFWICGRLRAGNPR
ncbi:MAG TPA: hypothetical protein VFJ58_00670 [Armatimonadota bacterium]|nr:hypothetical protein [Armatimonadota bacterium]